MFSSLEAVNSRKIAPHRHWPTGKGQQDEDSIVSRQAGIAELRSTLEEKLNASVAQKLELTYEDAGKLPAAAIVRIEGIELRLEKDYFDGCWTIATNEGSPRLLDRVEEHQIGPMMVYVLEQRVAQLRS